MNNLNWLLRREFWENKGGFFWAPVITAAVFFGFSLMGVVTAEAFKVHFMGDIKIGVSLKELTSKLKPEDIPQLGAALDVALLGFGHIIQIVLGFVVAFYLLGSLYDDRRDRSVLFWKSLPISDRDTVISKAVAATVIAPVIALAVSMALQLALLLLLSSYVLFYGINPHTVIWGPAEPTAVWGKMLLSLPVNALWSLPAVGWLMLVSAWARSKPFLWAVLVPVGSAILINWFDLLKSFAIPDQGVWQYGVARLLLGTFPSSWQIETGPVEMARGIEVMGLNGATTLAQLGQVISSPGMWIGAVVGIAMLFVATRLRRWRDEA